MPKLDSIVTTDPSAPTTSEMDAMWRIQRERELADIREYERRRAFFARWIYGEVA